MKLAEKIIKANENIEYLIEEIIALKKSEMNNYCVSPDGCTHISCSECKEKFFDNMFDKMVEKYRV